MRVVVGLSGGVDSSVAALLLKKQGHDVLGLFMKNWHDTDVTISDDCPWEEDSKDALLVAEKLGIPFQTIDFSEEYKARIVDYMFKEYKAGRTPNPDVLCNKEIKYNVFLKTALELGADAVATGHYCRKEEIVKNDKIIYKLLSGKDANKDQSYFLCQLSQEQLKYALFPIGNLTKTEVREMALENSLITAQKKDSQGLCFIGKVKLPDFLKQQLKPRKGKLIEIPSSYYVKKVEEGSQNKELYSEFYGEYKESDGSYLGEHQGAHFYTIGQRKGLNIGGTGEPMYVIATDVINNIVYLGKGDLHPGLYKSKLLVDEKDFHWVRPDLKIRDDQVLNVMARIRYRQPLQDAQVLKKNGCYEVSFFKAQRGITAGQFVAFYLEDELVASGVIRSFAHG